MLTIGRKPTTRVPMPAKSQKMVARRNIEENVFSVYMYACEKHAMTRWRSKALTLSVLLVLTVVPQPREARPERQTRRGEAHDQPA